MGRIGSLIFLLGLAASAGMLPKQLEGRIKPPHFGKEAASNLAQFRSLLQETAQGRAGRTEGPEALDPETRQFLAEISPEVEVVRSPAMERLLHLFKAEDAGSVRNLVQKAAGVHRFYEERQAAIVGLVWAVPSALLGLGALGCLAGLRGMGRGLAVFCLSLCRKWLMLVSLAALAAFTAGRINLWSVLPEDFWVAPIAGVLASAAFLRLMDFNFPVWNKTFASLLFPLASCAVILGWGVW